MRGIAQARQQFSQMASAVTSDGRQMSTITHATGDAVDHLRTTLAGAGIGMHNIAGGSSRLRAELGQLGHAATSAGGSLQTIVTATAAFTASMYAINRTLGSVLPLFARFDDVMRQVKVATEATGEQYLAMTQLAETMGATTRYSAQEAAAALLVLSTSGLKAGEAMTALPATLELAAASATDLARTAEISTTIMNGYGFSAINLAAINDVLIRATLDTNSSLADLGAAFSYVGPVAKATGLDFKDTAAVLGVMSDAGFKGERGGTALAGALSRLINPTKEVEKTLGELGVTVSASGGKLINLIDIFRKLTAAGVEPPQMMKIFGEEAGRAMIAAADRGVPAMEKLRASFDDATRTANRSATEMEGGLGGSFRNLSSAAEGLGLTLGRDLAPAAKSTADAIASLFNSLSQLPAPLRENIELGAALVGGLTLWVLGLRPLIAAVTAYTAAQIAATAATITFSRVLKAAGWVGLGLAVYEAGRYLHFWGDEAEKAADKTDALTGALEKKGEAIAALSKPDNAAIAALSKPDNAPIAALSKPGNTPTERKKSGGGGDGGDTSQLSAFKSDLERRKEATGDYFRNTLQMEEAFWQEKRKISGLSQRDLVGIDREIYQIHQRQAHDSLNERLELLREEMENALEGSQDRVEIAKRAAKEIGDAYGYESKEFIRARRVIEGEERAHQAKMREFASLRIQADKTQADSRIAMEEENLRYKQEMEIMSAQEVIQAKRALEEQSFQNTMRAMHAELELKRRGTTDELHLRNDIKRAVLGHNLAIQKSNHDLAVKTRADFHSMVAPIRTSIESSLTGLIMQTTTVSQAIENLMKSMLEQFVGFLVKRAAAWAEQKVFDMIFEDGARIAGLAAQLATDAASIKMSAVTASAGAFAATAAIPIVGPALAPEAAAAAYASVMAMLAGLVIPSAAQGWDIPAGINPITKLHEREMVLPRAQADAVRSMAAGGIQRDAPISIHVNTIDAKGFETFLHNNAHTLAPAIRRMGRNAVQVKR